MNKKREDNCDIPLLFLGLPSRTKPAATSTGYLWCTWREAACCFPFSSSSLSCPIRLASASVLEVHLLWVGKLFLLVFLPHSSNNTCLLFLVFSWNLNLTVKKHPFCSVLKFMNLWRKKITKGSILYVCFRVKVFNFYH